ncbi:putative Glucoside xylosyltransferase 1 [Hypsibius exemplaris]|uniref:UDP-D-xylose:beta-D-glucoside alpha-1,3-D-xylosyltransferase n=1 Tax=Hypsibius exemplaris TaxID=2072580 RepID=A0A1W0WI73_HYPEX|nr:putative Glucoside xylosyltransferase 1 [Hypsibius exemplaris]
MITNHFVALLLASILTSVTILVTYSSYESFSLSYGQQFSSGTEGQKRIVVVTVGCGKSIYFALNSLKSILISKRTDAPTAVYLFTEKNQHGMAREKYDSFLRSNCTGCRSVELFLLHPSYPSEKGRLWLKMWRPCATQRLFLSDISAFTDAVIYVDSDTIFLAPVEDLWEQFALMNDSQAIGMASEHEIGMEWDAHYGRLSHVPFVPPLGVNSGVLLMNLTKLRAVNFVGELVRDYRTYKENLNYHDQDLLNIYLHRHPDRFFHLNCSWNYRMSHCIKRRCNCRSARDHGVRLVHGNAKTFIKKTTQEFRWVSDAIAQVDLPATRDVKEELIRRSFKTTVNHTFCGSLLFNAFMS